ncbi:glycosyltransferase family protein [Marinilabilia sp.]|jgi:uncharacterized protein (TIGR00661 family)
MKILYAIQGTGNGHIARAIDLIPEFGKYGEVDVLLSGQHSELQLPFDIKYRMQGFGFFFGTKGGIDVKNTWKKNSIGRFFKEVAKLPVEKYDLVISDFEPVSAWACRLKGKKCFGMSHQSSVIDSAAPQPKQSKWWGKGILKHYAPVTDYVGFHFKALNDQISTPVIRQSVRQLAPENKGHYTVYLPAYSDIQIISVLSEIREIKWEVFSKHAKVPYSFNHISVKPVDSSAFVKSMAGSHGVLCNAGFETPAEALFLKKKLCVVPMKNQYEQSCNAAMLEEMGVPVLRRFSSVELPVLKDWILMGEKVEVNYPDNVAGAVQKMMALAESYEPTHHRKGIPDLAGALGA